MRWLDDMCTETKVLYVKNWKEMALNRNGWNHIVEKAKTYKGL
jgi:hypothetical protein